MLCVSKCKRETKKNPFVGSSLNDLVEIKHGNLKCKFKAARKVETHLVKELIRRFRFRSQACSTGKERPRVSTFQA